MRLARFNTNIDVVDKRYFQGLPSPAAAGLIAGLVWAMEAYDVARADIPWLAWALTLFAGFTMVSNVKFYSGKDINLRRAVPFWVVIVMVLVLLLISIEPSHVLWGVMFAYGVSGYVMWVVMRWRTEATQKQYAHIRDAIEEANLTALARMLQTTPPDTVIGNGGRTVLMVAIEEVNLPALELLIARGASLEAVDELGLTALGLAAENGFQEAVEELLAAGANPNYRDVAGNTPLDLAEEHGAQDTVAVLLRYGAKASHELPPLPADLPR